jgi:HlyD family secretion protein
MDREISLSERKRRVVRRVMMALIAIAVVGVGFAATVEWLRPSIDRDRVQFARVERGTIEATLEANGTVVPLDEQVVSSPVEARVLRIERRAGDRVKAGDALLTLDTAATQLEAARLEDRLAQRVSAADELRLKLDESIATLRAQIEQKKLDGEIVRYTAQQRATLRSEGLIAESDARAAAASAKKSDIELRALEQALARTLRSRDVQLASARADIAMAARERDESRRQLALAMLRADHDGVLTSIVNEPGATVRRGDVLARIADLTSYRVVATISDIHAVRLSSGMRARVKLDDAAIGGTIDSVDPRIENGVVRFYVTLDEPAHPSLRNNLRADVFVVTDRKSGALVIRRGTLGRIDPNHAFVIRGETAVRVPITFGLAGDRTIEIVDGANEGDEIVISDMSEYRHIKELRVK